MKIRFTILSIVILLLSCSEDQPVTPESDTVEDIDGNIYKTVTIGAQVWMSENLKVTRYRNGDAIYKGASLFSWKWTSIGMYCEYEDILEYSRIYGRLYNFNAVKDRRNIAPEGWRVASDSDWTVLIDFLGGETQAYPRLLDADTTHWPPIPSITKNESGFTARPGSYRNPDGYFGENNSAWWWSGTAADTSIYSDDAKTRFILPVNNGIIIVHSVNNRYGLSVRCVKNN